MKRRLLSLVLAMIMVLGMLGNITVYADEKLNLIELTDEYVVSDDGNFYLINEKELRDKINRDIEFYKKDLNGNSAEQYLDSLQVRLYSLNRLSQDNQIVITEDGRIIDSSIHVCSTRSANVYSETHWWGRKHIFYSDNAARDYAYNVRMSAHANAGAALIAGAVFSGVGSVPNGITAIWAYSIADSVDYNANKSGEGVILEVTWILAYRCYPR